ncbi:MAG: cytochrome c3 family protein [Acidobacteriota bacterium]
MIRIRTLVRSGLLVLAVASLVLAASGHAGAQESEEPQQPERAEEATASGEQEGPAAGRGAGRTSCVICHADTELFDEGWAGIVGDADEGVHADVGLSCHDCHGGNPDPALADDTFGAMDEDYSPNPYIGVPDTTDVPDFCGSCHSDATFMRRFQPDARVDQEQEYWTSHHGEALAAGDIRVATCTSCHGVHGILRSDNPRSSVYPTRVAETCRSCHADVQQMTPPGTEGEATEGEQAAGDETVDVDQYARWRRSVHAAALLDRGDLSAPTCNDCHGNHGATPPGVDSVVFVCGQCHGREAEIFRGSPKHAGYEEHNEFLLDAGDEGCALCHFEPEPQARITDMTVLGECTACHGNHGIVRPTVAMLSPLPETPCAFCHAGPDEEPTEDVTDATRETRERFADLRRRLLDEAASRGLDGDARFDWLVERTLQLPPHTRETADGDSTPRTEFRLLFDKFRIGKTSYEYEDPVSGEMVRAPVVRCESCHAPADAAADGEGVGIQAAGRLLNAMTSLAARTAQAERTLLAARRGGVETREAAAEVGAAVDAHIQLQVLLHTFEIGEETPFREQHREGMEQASAALQAGHEALEELDWRRRGLAVALVIITLVLIGLALKIREVSAR